MRVAPPTSRTSPPSGSAARARRARGPDLPRPRPDRHQPRPPRPGPGPGRGRAGDTLVVPKLDRLARSVPDARAHRRHPRRPRRPTVPRRQIYDPTDPMGKMFFNILATFAEFEVDLLRLRTREGMAVARAKGRLKGRQPKLSGKQQTNFAACTAPATTPSPTSPNCSTSPDRPCIAHWQNRTRLRHPCSRRRFSQARCVALFLHRMDRRPETCHHPDRRPPRPRPVAPTPSNLFAGPFRPARGTAPSRLNVVTPNAIRCSASLSLRRPRAWSRCRATAWAAASARPRTRC